MGGGTVPGGSPVTPRRSNVGGELFSRILLTRDRLSPAGAAGGLGCQPAVGVAARTGHPEALVERVVEQGPGTGGRAVAVRRAVEVETPELAKLDVRTAERGRRRRSHAVALEADLVRVAVTIDLAVDADPAEAVAGEAGLARAQLTRSRTAGVENARLASMAVRVGRALDAEPGDGIAARAAGDVRAFGAGGARILGAGQTDAHLAGLS